MYKQKGIKQIQDIELKDFTWWINSVRYDWSNNKAYVEVHAKETHLVHSRSFEFDCSEEWTSQTALEKILEIETFKGSEQL